ncbi:MAG: hypothetical protein KGI38_11950 [Thaumarchaeota archaeon]|nr:hypothetical protein [Nitrososphaerota archaeon]
MKKGPSRTVFFALYIVSSLSYFAGYVLSLASIGWLGFVGAFGTQLSVVGLLGYMVVVIANAALWWWLSRG